MHACGDGKEEILGAGWVTLLSRYPESRGAPRVQGGRAGVQASMSTGSGWTCRLS